MGNAELSGSLTPAELVLWGGFAIGLAFGVSGQITGFCLARGLRGRWRGGDDTALRGFAVALAIALAGTQLLGYAGIVTLSKSMYLANPFSWLLLPVGAFVFGCGMVLANGCGARALVLLGQGNLRSFVVLICLGIAAYMTLTGIVAPLRTALQQVSSVQIEGGSFGTPGLRLATASVAGVALLAWALRARGTRAAPRDLAGGVVAGLLVVAGWLLTGRLGQDEFDPIAPASLSFVAPVGESIQYLMIATGVKPGFGVMIVAGVLAGACASALLRRRFRLEGFSSPQDMLRYMAGGALMGVGGTLAMGCSIGQGLTGLSTLSVSSIVAAAGILAGNAWTLHRTGSSQ